MTLPTIIGDPACDDILRWLDAHSVTLSLGLPAQLLHKRWAEAGREPAQLGSSLQRLFDEDWVALTPGREPVHLRFTVEGFRRLIDITAAPPAAAAAAPATSPPPAAPDPAGVAAAQRSHLSELRLRNDILGVYRELRLKADSRLIGMTLSRYWQEMGNRAGDLRTGLDVVVRDGLLLPRLIGMDRYWQLTPDGEAWLLGPVTPEVLLQLAPPLADVAPAPTTEVAHRLVARTLAGQAAGAAFVPYERLQSAWAYASSFDDNALLTGLDLLLKHGHASLDAAAGNGFALNERGRAFAGEETPRFSKLLAKLSRVLGSNP
ncbi:MAG: hypothetical protein JWQ90_2189 [Hydrocarboniphaga sp.]|uniref:hypothetical protein n=1 Tax=Hydrocarboniphaga sp. TaxID=2033016 RepID=UPI0026324948|nr:hypothetical protein [Hydrocarboniphaga sp.]MDB5969739.1 hypothetical protein [Hydrocarboniphaga sp.]